MRILILIFLLALSITANAECEVNGYYRADGTWVNGYIRSGDCWNGKVIGYDAQGRTAEERRAIQVKQNRIIIPFILLLIFLLGTWSEKVAENSRLRILINIIIYPAALYLLYMIILDPLALIVILFGLFVWNWIASRKEKKKSKQISEKKKTYLSTTAISDINNITNKFHLFDHLVKHNLIYRQNNSYKLTEIGIDIGGEYRSNKNGLQWIVWKKNCLDSYIADLKNNLLNTSTKTENLKRNKLKQTTCNSSEIVVEGNTINLGKELNFAKNAPNRPPIAFASGQ